MRIQKTLSNKITFFVLFIILMITVIIIATVYFIFLSFYKGHLTKEVEHRILAHSQVIESNFTPETFEHVFKMEEKQDVNVIFFDPSGSVLYYSKQVNEDQLDLYQQWAQENIFSSKNPLKKEPITEYKETPMEFHIPHIWSLQSVAKNGEVIGYLFIDQDTGEFEKAKVSLLLLLFAMGIFAFMIGILLTVYLTKMISRPIQEMGTATNEIAKGNFKMELKINSEDEIGKLAKDIQSMGEQLKNYRDSRQQFISNISHDLRTPLTYIKGYSAIMKESGVVKEQEWKRNLEVIYNEATRMEHLVKDLFQLTQLDNGQIELQKEDVPLIPFLKSILESRALILKEKGILYEFNYPSTSIMLRLDQHRMMQVFTNLIENSLRYTKMGGEITLSVEEHVNFITISVTDTGEGIPLVDIPHIFERFYRVDKSRSSESGGSGLGLAIAKQIIELHGGKIEVHSEVGVGTTFIIQFKK
jgi:signal transduction histidine kinase